MRVVYFGAGSFGVPTLQWLSQHHTVTGIVTQPDKPAGRGADLTPTPIAAWAAANLPGVPLLKPVKCNAPEVVAAIRGWEAEAWVVIAFGQKLGKALLEDRFAVNLHASLLPRWRGAAPINAAVLAGDRETGNSVITLADTMDAGLVLAQSRRAIEPLQTAGELHDLLAADGPALISEVLDRHARGATQAHAQDPALVTLAGKFVKADGVVDFSAPASVCRARVHGLTPWPGVTVSFRGAPVKLLRVREAEGVPAGAQAAALGSIVDPSAGLVACGGGTALQILELQPAGKRAQSWKDFQNGQRTTLEDRFV